MTSLVGSIKLSPRWLDRAVLAAVLLAGATALSLNLVDPDLWGHVQYGRDALRSGLPTTTTYSYIADGYAWVNHEIVAEIGLAAINDTFGGTGLLVAKLLLGVGVLLLLLRECRRQETGLTATAAIILMVAAALGRHWMLRPQLVSYVSFALMLSLLNWCFAGWANSWQLRLPQAFARCGIATEPNAEAPLTYDSRRLRFLWLMPLLMVFWTNSHGGFLAGLCVYIAYLCLRGLEVWSQRGRESYGLLRRFALMIVACVAATFINPYGPQFHEWLYHDLAVPRPEIMEWRAPDLLDPYTLPCVLLAVVWLASLWLSKRRQDFTQNVVLALIAWQATQHHRHLAFFAIAAGWWLPGQLQSMLERFGSRPDNQPLAAGLTRRGQVAIALAVCAAIALCTGRLWNRTTNLLIERDMHPVAAIDYIAQQRLTGRMFVTFNWAQYALAAVGAKSPNEPGLRIHSDGRCRTSFSQQMLDEHFDFILGNPDARLRYRDNASTPFDPSRVLTHGRPNLVLISRVQEPAVETMRSNAKQWALLYQDELSQLWGRRSRYDDPQSSDYLPPQQRFVGDRRQRGYAAWPAIPTSNPAPASTGSKLAQTAN